jgi:uncharacterized protein (DUF3820 family)
MSWTEPVPNVFLDNDRRSGFAVKELPCGSFDWGALIVDVPAEYADWHAAKNWTCIISNKWMRMVAAGLAPNRDEAIRLAKWSVET